jgi:hypothetical protein
MMLLTTVAKTGQSEPKRGESLLFVDDEKVGTKQDSTTHVVDEGCMCEWVGRCGTPWILHYTNPSPSIRY